MDKYSRHLFTEQAHGRVCKEERAMPHSLPPHTGTAERRLVCEAGHYLEQAKRHAGERKRPLHKEP